ncbi:MAG TPA: phosphatase PAP2 family protein [Saprospiraceae bacterium]|nr:phosphatase PAP2 family protein [Saprospiraceae bacterium]
MKNRIFPFLFLLLPSIFFAQADTLRQKRHHLLKKSILPATLIVSGSLISGSAMEIKLRDYTIQKVGANDRFPIDDYLQAAPIAELYLADLLGVKAKNHWFDQSKNLLMTAVLNQILVVSLKRTINKTRPNGANHAFPSGHTSFAFANATVLYEEFKETNPFLAYSGFGFATVTGSLRVANNRHWLSDVLAGAGIGLLSATLIYHFEPLKNWNPFLRKQHLVIRPQISANSWSVRGQWIF